MFERWLFSAKTPLVLFVVTVAAYSVGLFLVVFSLEFDANSVSAFIMPPSDATEYVTLARNLAAGNGFTLYAGEPEYFRTPGYPLVLSVIFLFGGGLVSVTILQILLAGVSVVLTYLVGRRLVSEPIAIGAALLFAAVPTTFLASAMTLTEAVFVVLFLLAAYLSVTPPNTWKSLAQGMLLGVLILIRPMFLFLYPIFLVYRLIVDRKAVFQALKHVALVLGVTCLIIFPWVLRNYSESGHFRISTIGPYNALFYNIVEFETYRRAVPKDVIQEEIFHSLGERDTTQLRSFKYFDQESELAMSYLSAHPLAYGIFHLLKTAPFFLGSSVESAQRTLAEGGVISSAPEDINLSSLILSKNYYEALRVGIKNPISTLETLIRFTLLVCAILFIFMALLRRSPFAGLALFLAVLSGVFALLVGPVSMPRYRLPIEPFLFVLGLGGMRVAWSFISRGARQIIQRIQNEALKEFIFYGMASGVALVIDVSLLFLLLSLGVHYLLSATAGFLVGLACIYLISIRWVFRRRRLLDKRKEFLVFSIIGLMGIGFNALILFGVVDILHGSVVVGKFISVVLVFLWNFFARRSILFTL